jgi:restriction system protein
MAVWLVRAGRRGEQEQIALDNGLVTIGWNEFPDLSGIENREAMAAFYREKNPDDSPSKAAMQVGQVWAFRERMKKGDLAVLPLHIQSAIAIGTIVGPYQYRSDLGSDVHHTRPVEWLQTDIPPTTFDPDILQSFRALMTVCQIKRNNAEERIKAILAGKPSPPPKLGEVEEDEDGEETFDIEQAARDQLLKYIQRKYVGHRLADLVDAVLQAEGYLTRVSPPGPDGGVDILAGSGPMGFSEPRMCVQVKSSASPADVNVLRGLQGILQNFRAKQGLLVSWGGYKSSVLREDRQSFFQIRLWDSGDLLKAIFKNYDKFPDQLQAELPLKRMWALVLEE